MNLIVLGVVLGCQRHEAISTAKCHLPIGGARMWWNCSEV